MGMILRRLPAWIHVRRKRERDGVRERERDGGHRTRRVAGVTVRRSMPSGDQSPCYPNLEADFGENCLHLM